MMNALEASTQITVGYPKYAGMSKGAQACLNAPGAQVCAAEAQLEKCLRF